MQLPSNNSKNHENRLFWCLVRPDSVKLRGKSFVWSVRSSWTPATPPKFNLDYSFPIFYSMFQFFQLLHGIQEYGDHRDKLLGKIFFTDWENFPRIGKIILHQHKPRKNGFFHVKHKGKIDFSATTHVEKSFFTDWNIFSRIGKIIFHLFVPNDSNRNK